MDRAVILITVLLLGISLAAGRPQKTSIDRLMENGPLSSDDLKKSDDVSYVRSGEYMNLLDAEKWKELLAQGKVRDMVDAIQRALGSKRPVHMRTEWGGPDLNEDGNAVRNTVNWNAYEGRKSSLNLVMDSKFSRKNGKVDFIDPNFGINFQLKY